MDGLTDLDTEHPFEDEHVHVIPIEDVFRHWASYLCPCQPRFDSRAEDTDQEVWVHKIVKESLN